MSTPVNPYAAPDAVVDDVSDALNLDAEKIRQEHLKHEASLQGVGSLYAIGGVFMILGGLLGGGGALFAGGVPSDMRWMGALFLVYVAFGVAFFTLGRGLRKLRPWARIPTILLGCLGLLGFPIGTIINGYILWLALSKKGRYILSPEYSAIVAATPHIKYKTPLWVWIIVGLIVLLIVVAITMSAIH